MSSVSPQSDQSQASDPISPNVEDLYLESYAFTTAAAIVGSVDRKIFVLLKDGRNLHGILRTFDQFANLVLQDTFERIYLGEEGEAPTRFSEAYRGVFMVRGENVVMLGELDIDTEDDHLEKLEQVPFEVAERELREQQAQKIREQKVKTKQLLQQGFINDFHITDLY